MMLMWPITNGIKSNQTTARNSPGHSEHISTTFTNLGAQTITLLPVLTLPKTGAVEPNTSSFTLRLTPA